MCFYYLACSFSFLIFFEVELIYTVNVALYNVTDFCCTTRVIQLYICVFFFFNILFHYSLSQNIDSSSLCYTVISCFFKSIPHIIICISVSVSLFHRYVCLCCILDPADK